MTPCPRSRDVEGLHDDELAPARRADVLRHLEGCAVCRAERDALSTLRAELRALPSAELDELALRRQRGALLARAAAELAQPAPVTARRGRRALWAGAACALIAAGAAWRVQPWAFGARGEEPGVQVLVVAAPGAEFERHAADEGTEIVLHAGRIDVEVRGQHTARCVRVRTPDAEITDLGTVFSVEVADHRTRRVEVQDGEVLLDRSGLPALTLHAGERYEAVPEQAHAEPAPGAEAPSTPRPTKPEERTSAPAHDFEAGVQALHARRFTEAERTLARFVRQHGRDPRVEDATYLRIIALRALGDARASALAEAYVRDFPRALHRSEVARMLAAEGALPVSN